MPRGVVLVSLLHLLLACAPPPAQPPPARPAADPSGAATAQKGPTTPPAPPPSSAPPPAPVAPPASAPPASAPISSAPITSAPPPEEPAPEARVEAKAVGKWSHREASEIGWAIESVVSGCVRTGPAKIRFKLRATDYTPEFYGPHDPHPPYPSFRVSVVEARTLAGKVGKGELGCVSDALPTRKLTAASYTDWKMPEHEVSFDVSVPTRKGVRLTASAVAPGSQPQAWSPLPGKTLPGLASFPWEISLQEETKPEVPNPAPGATRSRSIQARGGQFPIQTAAPPFSTPGHEST